ncbi:hypothetical protein [Flavivirga eckloniae]|uniref:Peptidase S74 domain-containing protein n=1 Tax=Flavivirga eckloniae TaxID=1803846 RepID=A0A2K9PS91_9FLAO|nr:hypothetical protein [Flavivirga eckloniae]AUP79668.1 hypothetical protein C1H87_13505 [Flavivirga eckloniae]
MKKFILGSLLFAISYNTDAQVDTIYLDSSKGLVGDYAALFTDIIRWDGVDSYYGRQNSGGGNPVSNHYFHTNFVDRMIINSNGNVGIGTTTPTARLDLKSSNFDIISLSTMTHTTPFVIKKDADGLKLWDEGSLSNIWEARTNGHFIVNNKVGIGTTSPTDKLHVNGSVRSESQFVISGIGAFNADSGNMKMWSVGSLILASGSNNEHMRIQSNGNIGIGTADTKGFKLGVQGKIAAEEVKVAVYTNWADFVFKSNYNLPTLKEVEKHIKEKGHLKDIPSEEEVAENGILLGEMDSKLLQKIEELTLYTIAQEKTIEEQAKKIEQLELLNKKFLELQSRLEKLEPKK